MSRRANGFTLLEVLISLVIVGLLLVSLGGGIRLGFAAIGTEAHVTAHSEDLVILDQAFHKLVTHATAGSNLVQMPFRGGPRVVQFTTVLSGPPERTVGGLADVTIGVDARHRLVMTWQPHYRKLSPAAPPPDVEVLADAVDDVEFAYEAPVAAGQNRGALTWRRSWNEPGLPDLIRLHVVLRDKRDGTLPDIVAETKLRDRLL